MLFWTTGNVPFFFFQMIVMAQWFVNMTKTTTWVLWITANSGFIIFLYLNQCVLGGIDNFWRALYWSRTTGNRPFLFDIWLVVGLKFPLSNVWKARVLNITIVPTDLNTNIKFKIVISSLPGASEYLDIRLCTFKCNFKFLPVERWLSHMTSGGWALAEPALICVHRANHLSPVSQLSLVPGSSMTYQIVSTLHGEFISFVT